MRLGKGRHQRENIAAMRAGLRAIMPNDIMRKRLRYVRNAGIGSNKKKGKGDTGVFAVINAG